MATPIAHIYVVGGGRACDWKVRMTSDNITILTAPDSDMNLSTALELVAQADHESDEIEMWASVIGDVCLTAFYCGDFPIDRKVLRSIVDESDMIRLSKEIIDEIPF